MTGATALNTHSLPLQVTGAAMAYEVIGGSEQCAKLIKEATPLIHAAGAGGRAESLPEALQPCGPLDAALDLAAWEQSLFGNFQGFERAHAAHMRMHARTAHESACESTLASRPEGKPRTA